MDETVWLDDSWKSYTGECGSQYKQKRLLGRATVQSHCGTLLGNIKVTDLNFANDVAILSESLETLVAALDAFSNEAKPLGLEVSWTKTKVQEFGYLLREPVQSVRACGEDIEVTENFTYLAMMKR
ncbi:uncharacterized protein [Penaeus vannamei]|uniref:uncharacterized protein n=1 Tax=Penaeus vannamei TaxID=6689 RepID=UPI00387F9FC7